ncbi:MAG: hypothetical protein JW940_22465 [Polyangiaceae bacterium]|nr:hypothetical protein [Polyangiaceae bacterium]
MPCSQQPRFPQPLDEGWLPRLSLPQCLEAKAAPDARRNIPQVDEELDGLLVVLPGCSVAMRLSTLAHSLLVQSGHCLASRVGMEIDFSRARSQ